MYRGVQFRSRLEAKWAAFFDQCGWRWSYEPFDLYGWIPDFLIGESRTLVEIKPYMTAEEFADTQQKIIAAGYRDKVVLLGLDPTWRVTVGEGLDPPTIGWLSIRRGGTRFTRDLHFGYSEGCGTLGLCPLACAWNDVITRARTRVELFHDNHQQPADALLWQLWAQATNEVQWRGPR
jgi:hypothetical protein